MDLAQLSIILGIAAGMVQLAGYIVYLRVTEHTNAGSWAIWAIGAVVDVISYAALTGDCVKDILPVVCAIACVYTFLHLLAHGRFGCPDRIDLTFLGIDSLITFIWWRGINAATANLLYQASTFASFVPMIHMQMAGKDDEHPLPWAIWGAAYALFFCSVALRLGRWEELAYPATHLVTHLAVAVIALKTREPSQ